MKHYIFVILCDHQNNYIIVGALNKTTDPLPHPYITNVNASDKLNEIIQD